MTGIVRLNEKEVEKLIPSVFPSGPSKKDFALSFMADNELSVGVLSGTIIKGIAFIRYFYVDPHFRRIGVGKSLLDEVTKRADSLSLAVGIPVKEEELTSDLDALLFRCGFKKEAPLPLLTFSLNDIKNFLPAEPKMPERVVPLEKAAPRLNAYSNFLCSKEGGSYPPIQKDELLPESVFYIDDNKIEGSLLVSKNEEDLEILFLHSKSPRMLMELIVAAFLLAKQHYPMSTKVYSAFLRENIFESAKKIIGQEGADSRMIYFERSPK